MRFPLVPFGGVVRLQLLVCRTHPHVLRLAGLKVECQALQEPLDILCEHGLAGISLGVELDMPVTLTVQSARLHAPRSQETLILAQRDRDLGVSYLPIGHCEPTVIHTDRQGCAFPAAHRRLAQPVVNVAASGINTGSLIKPAYRGADRPGLTNLPGAGVVRPHTRRGDRQ